eukprot:TRINITY_DN844_c0_g1_i1.p1 TRINITY_DN844_c0_g1~~TRINITY_DN844_c0_g1_i1.p1  ORF type:complete len:339 (+),score=49.18 TRINITY_DN844_c0_g1_i1:74-1090(+)
MPTIVFVLFLLAVCAAEPKEQCFATTRQGCDACGCVWRGENDGVDTSTVSTTSAANSGSTGSSMPSTTTEKSPDLSSSTGVEFEMTTIAATTPPTTTTATTAAAETTTTTTTTIAPTTTAATTTTTTTTTLPPSTTTTTTTTTTAATTTRPDILSGGPTGPKLAMCKTDPDCAFLQCIGTQSPRCTFDNKCECGGGINKRKRSAAEAREELCDCAIMADNDVAEEDGAGSPVALIAGLVGGVAVLFLAIGAFVCVSKRRARSNEASVNSAAMQSMCDASDHFSTDSLHNAAPSSAQYQPAPIACTQASDQFSGDSVHNARTSEHYQLAPAPQTPYGMT